MKKIADKVYVHKSAEDTLPEALRALVTQAFFRLGAAYTDIEYDLVKVDPKEGSVTFLWVPGFDTDDEPALEKSVKVIGDSVKRRFEESDNPPIYHGRHFFVKADYRGFDVAAAKARYDKWKKSGIAEIVGSKIGRLKYWRDVVLPKLKGVL